MNSEIYIEIAKYLWNDEIVYLFIFSKDNPNLIDFRQYLALRIMTRTIH